MGFIHELRALRKTDQFRVTERDYPDMPSTLGHEDGTQSFAGPCEMEQIKGAQELSNLSNSAGVI